MTLKQRIEALATAIGNYLRDSVLPRLLPAGGASGQVLAKTAATNYAVGWADPGGAPDQADPATPRVLFDDFVTQSTETGEVGFLNWSFTNGSIVAANNQQNHPGIQRRTGGTTANQVASFYLGAAVGTTVFRFDEFDEFTWIFAQAAAGIADTTWQFGILSAMGNIAPAHGVYLEKLPADTNWFFVCRNGGVQTRVNSGVAANTTAWIKIKVRRVSAAEVAFSINGGAEVSITTNIPDAADSFNIGAQHAATGTTARSVDLDFFSLKLLSVTR